MGLNELNHSAINALANQKLLEQQYNQAQAEVNKWQRCAELAMKQGREDLAREAIVRKHKYSKTAASLKTQLEQLGVKIDNPQGNPTNQAPDKQDPAAILDKSIRDTREAVQVAVASFESLQQQYSQARKEANTCNEQAQVALQKDDENLAFQSLVGKTVQGKIATALKTQLDRQLAIVEILKRNLIALENVKEMLKTQPFTQVNSELDEDLAVIEAEICLPTPDQTGASPSHESVDVKWESLAAQIDQL